MGIFLNLSYHLNNNLMQNVIGGIRFILFVIPGENETFGCSLFVKTFVIKGDRILDPFTGVGTIPFEAALNGS